MVDAAKDYVAGMAAGVATVVTGHPFDTVKVKLQTQNTAVGQVKYRGALDCCAHILRNEGVRGFYKGATSSFAGMAMESSVLFGVYTQVKKSLKMLKIEDGPHGQPNLLALSISGSTAGASVALILCPAELVKCRLQVQAKTVASLPGGGLHYKGPLDCALKTVRSDGLLGMFRGAVPTIMRESFGNIFFFGTYELTRYHALTLMGIDPGRGPASVETQELPGSEGSGPGRPLDRTLREALLEGGVAILSGGLAGVAFWASILPFDVVKTRIQTERNPHANRKVVHNLRMLYREAGLRGLYSGLTPTLVRAFPANAASIVTWEVTARLLKSIGTPS